MIRSSTKVRPKVVKPIQREKVSRLGSALDRGIVKTLKTLVGVPDKLYFRLHQFQLDPNSLQESDIDLVISYINAPYSANIRLRIHYLPRKRE